VSLIRPGDHVFVGSACATPRALLRALDGLQRPPAGVVLTHFLADRGATGAPSGSYRQRVFYVGRDLRSQVRAGRVDYVPVSLADIPSLIDAGRLRVDVALIQVAPPDTDGACSLGISVDVTRAAALAARTVLAEVNPAMPRTGGDSRIPVERIDRFVPVTTPVIEYVHEPADDVAEQIARYVARLIADRSTLQVGLGRVANRMVAHLTNRRGLRLHSDVLTEPVVDIVEAGCVAEPLVASLAMGTRRLYDLVDGNPAFEFHPIDHVCDPTVIARKPRMVSVTQAFAIDIGGQVCSESLDGELYGGLAAGPAFHRGALASPGGIPIVCLASRTPAGRPAIRPELAPQEPVSIARGDVHWVITEYGTAYLFGRSLAERAVALIEIAHPDDRAMLLEAAVERGVVRPEQKLRSRAAYPVGEERDIRLRDDSELRLRPTRTSDAGALQALFYRLSKEDVRTRFMQHLTSLTDSAAEHLCSVGYEEEMAFAAVIGPAENERIVGAACYYVDPATGLADVAYMVDPDWQGMGLGRRLHARMVDYARGHGVRGFTADVLVTNAAMVKVFRGGDHDLTLSTYGEVYEVTMRFTGTGEDG
jgi:acyl-CoA hydrolase/GNAT superfamily N-acetyltransferase